ncbi:MAG: TIR domain-containing protein [Byssovorax cruenta]
MPDHKLHVFLCHASQDKPIVREFYQRLGTEGWIDPWLDEEKLLPGQDWDLEIEKAVEAADAVIVCVSNQSVTKEGYVQKEIRKVLDIALEKPEETIFIIPLRLDDCELPRRLRTWQYVDYFPAGQRSRAYQRLLQSLRIRFDQLVPGENSIKEVHPEAVEYSPSVVEPRKTTAKEMLNGMVASLHSKESGDVDAVGSLPLIFYFLMAGLDATGPSEATVEILLALSAILAGIALLIRKKIPATVVFKIAVIIHLLIRGLDYLLEGILPFAPEYLGGVAALISGAILVVTFRASKKRVVYSSISFALFLFLVGMYWIGLNLTGSSPNVSTLIMITSIVTSILLLMDL